ncbi:hypothetical protein BJ741DRAFT_647370 [Chytriomyces cf. hyalinus JEL632]|nr:hypothetical protein BJ741DRAFT_647370 [Chytriomyces cf. hyalinus JEL632]
MDISQPLKAAAEKKLNLPILSHVQTVQVPSEMEKKILANRIAQKAFRERKQQKMKALEQRVAELSHLTRMNSAECKRCQFFQNTALESEDRIAALEQNLAVLQKQNELLKSLVSGRKGTAEAAAAIACASNQQTPPELTLDTLLSGTSSMANVVRYSTDINSPNVHPLLKSPQNGRNATTPHTTQVGALPSPIASITATTSAGAGSADFSSFLTFNCQRHNMAPGGSNQGLGLKLESEDWRFLL